MKPITLKSIICVRDDLHAIDVDEALIIEDKNSGGPYGVELIARRLWQLLSQPVPVAELCETLLREYDVDRETCERDVLEFLNDSMHQGLIHTAK
jgi:hypothetical protein